MPSGSSSHLAVLRGMRERSGRDGTGSGTASAVRSRFRAVGGSLNDQARAAQEAMAAGDAILERVNRLASNASKRKRATVVNKHKHAWHEEWQAMQGAEQQAWQGIQGFITHWATLTSDAGEPTRKPAPPAMRAAGTTPAPLEVTLPPGAARKATRAASTARQRRRLARLRGCRDVPLSPVTEAASGEEPAGSSDLDSDRSFVEARPSFASTLLPVGIREEEEEGGEEEEAAAEAEAGAEAEGSAPALFALDAGAVQRAARLAEAHALLAEMGDAGAGSAPAAAPASARPPHVPSPPATAPRTRSPRAPATPSVASSRRSGVSSASRVAPAAADTGAQVDAAFAAEMLALLREEQRAEQARRGHAAALAVKMRAVRELFRAIVAPPVGAAGAAGDTSDAMAATAAMRLARGTALAQFGEMMLAVRAAVEEQGAALRREAAEAEREAAAAARAVAMVEEAAAEQRAAGAGMGTAKHASRAARRAAATASDATHSPTDGDEAAWEAGSVASQGSVFFGSVASAATSLSALSRLTGASADDALSRATTGAVSEAEAGAVAGAAALLAHRLGALARPHCSRAGDAHMSNARASDTQAAASMLEPLPEPDSPHSPGSPRSPAAAVSSQAAAGSEAEWSWEQAVEAAAHKAAALLGAHESEDLALVDEVHRTIAATERRFLLELRTMHQELQQFLATTGATGGWEPADHQHFVKLLRTGAASRRADLTERACLELPHVPHEEIARHERWHHKVTGLQRQCREKSKAWVRVRRERLHQCYRRLLGSVLTSEVARNRAIESEISAATRRRTEEVMAQVREEQEAARRRREEEGARHRAEEARLEAERAAREMQFRAKQEALLEEHKRALAAQAAARAAEEARQRVIDAEAAQQRAQENAERVQFRKAALEERQEAERVRKAAEEEAAAARQAQLEQLARQVPYHDAVTALQRTRSETHAFAKARQETLARHEAVTAAAERLQRVDGVFGPASGFSDAQLFKDVRFKINLALRDAGLQDTPYARQLMATMGPSRPKPVLAPSRESPWAAR